MREKSDPFEKISRTAISIFFIITDIYLITATYYIDIL